MSPATPERRVLLIGGASLLASTSLPGQAVAQTATVAKETAMALSDYAVFTEFSPASKPMKDGWNRRVFTDTDIRKGNGIRCDMTTGILTLAPGVYRIAGMSMVTYDSGNAPPEMTNVRSPASAGYCRLRTFESGPDADPIDLHAVANDNPGVVCIGSPSTANLTPSLFETFYETDRPSRLVLEHQSGTKPRQIYLRVFTQDSRWHAFARIGIQRL